MFFWGVASLNVDCVSCKCLNPLRCFVFVFFWRSAHSARGSCVAVASSCWSVFFNCSCHLSLLLRWVIGFHVVFVGLFFNDCVLTAPVDVGYALRVSPVVTRLTVYRRPQVTHATSEYNPILYFINFVFCYENNIWWYKYKNNILKSCDNINGFPS